MSITDYFKKLGAPLANQRWSWGAVRATDNAVILRVWQDRKFIEDRVMYMMATHHAKYEDNETAAGYRERLAHVERIRAGAKCYMIMCLAKDADSSPRVIKSFDTTRFFVGGELVERDGDTFIKVVGTVTPDEASKPRVA